MVHSGPLAISPNQCIPFAVAENATVCPMDPAHDVLGSTRIEAIVGADENGSPPAHDASPATVSASPSRGRGGFPRPANRRSVEGARARATANAGMDK
jgi:hypothetical protein